MFGSWRNSLPAALGAFLLLFSAPAAALDQAAVEELETLLRDLGFDPGTVDGVVDDDTLAAIRRYQDFALLTGEPAPSEKLLNELRGVAAAFAALNSGGQKPAGAPATQIPDLGAGPGEPPAPEPVAEKVVVPPPPAPPKLKPLDAAPAPEDPAVPEDQVAARPPPAIPPAEAAPPEDAPPEAVPAAESDAEPVDETQARIDAELAPYRQNLEDGSLTREALARRFNDEGRQALQQADYGRAVLKFSVAVHLDPNFAGAYSNRGTAHQRQDETELAAQDFEKAKELGFGGFRLREGKNPFN